MPAAIFEELRAHLEAIDENPEHPLDSTLIRTATLQTTRDNAPVVAPFLIPLSVSVLTKIPSDHDLVVDFILKLLEWQSFTEAIRYTLPDQLILALKSPVPAINRLAITLIQRATYSASDAAIVAGLQKLILALIETWLYTPETGIAEQALACLAALLTIDLPEQGDTDMGTPPPEIRVSTTGKGQGLMWRGLFEDELIYSTFFVATDREDLSDIPRRAVTTAQARLLSFLLFVASCSFETITTCHFSAVEARHGLEPGQGLLDFAATRMVDEEDDILMGVTLYTFYRDLLQRSPPGSDWPLLFLGRHGIHQRLMRIYLHDEETQYPDLTYTPISEYAAAYASRYSSHLLLEIYEDSCPLSVRILEVIGEDLRRQPERTDAHLQVLTSLPYSVLLPNGTAARRVAWIESPFSNLLHGRYTPQRLNAIAKLFNGPKDPIRQGGNYARALYAICLSQTPTFWKQIVKLAETVAMKELALAAINVMQAVMTARWAPLWDLDHVVSNWLENTGMQISASSPPAVALLQPQAAEYIIPYLTSPAQLFSNLVAGGRGDVSGAAYKVGMAKFDTLQLLSRQLEGVRIDGQEDDFEQFRAALAARAEKGPWARELGIGGRIAALEL